MVELGSDGGGGGMPESDLISPQGVDNQISVILSSHTNAPLCFLQHHAKTTRTNDVIQRRFRVDTKVSIG